MLDNISALLLTEIMNDNIHKEINEIIEKEKEALSEPSLPSMSPRRQNVGGRQNSSQPGKPFRSLVTPSKPYLRDEVDPTDPNTMPGKLKITKLPSQNLTK